MKKRAIYWMIAAVSLLAGACQKKEQSGTPSGTPAPQTTETPAPDTTSSAAGTGTKDTKTVTPEVKTPALSPAERAAKLGFVQHLPQDTEVFMSFLNGSKCVDRIQSGKFWKLIQSQMGVGMMGEGRDFDPAGDALDEGLAQPDGDQDKAGKQADATDNQEKPGTATDPADKTQAATEEEPMGPATLFGTEFTIALGKTSGIQTAHLLTLNRRMSYFQMRSIAKAFANAAKSGDMSSITPQIAQRYGPELMKCLVSDPESGLAMFEKMNMPPIYLAFKTSAARRDPAAQQIAALVENLAFIGDMVEPVEITKSGKTFSGYKVSGAKISASMADERAEMEQVMDSASVSRFLAAVAKKDLIVLSGTLGDYVVLFVGSSTEDLKFATEINQSLAASDDLRFCDAYSAKELAAVIHGRKDALDQISLAAGGLSDMTNGLRDGLSGSTGLGDTRDLETLLGMVSDREQALRKLAGNEAMGVIAFFEDGMKIESYGGTDNGMVDWKTPNRLVSLGKAEDVAMFANLTTEAAYDEKAREYFEALMETAYAIAMKISEVPTQGHNMDEFKKWSKIIDTKFRSDLVTLWDSFNGNFGGGLGSERALVLDLKGSVPAAPGIPQAVVDQGKFPRITMIAPVKDRAKLSASWDSINSSITNALVKASDLTGEQIPMQKPISSEKDGYTTWFFSMPFFNNDFMPSVTVGEKWFAASTSKDKALDLITQATNAGETGTGLTFTINFKEFQKFATETHGMLEKNPDAFKISKTDMKDALKVINALDDFDKLTVHARREGGVMRTSVHFKTR